MKLTPFAKIILILLVLGAAVGGYRSWQRLQPAGRAPQPGSKNSAGQPADVRSGSASGELQFITSASKKGWIVEQIDKFNALESTRIPVVLKSVETREAMHQILDGKAKPALWSPSSVIWADRLAQAYQGKSILDTSDANSYRVILRTPLVFLTTKEKASVLRPLLGSTDCWANIRDLSERKKRVPWGNFKWAHADPLNANSGMLSLALILADYADRTGQSGSIETVANSAGFISYLKSVEKRFVYNTAVEKGSSALVASFVEDPSRYDFIVAYESDGLREVSKNSGLAVIYPNPTANSESAVAVLDGDWVTPEQKAGADTFLKFLAQPEAARDGLKEHFRPVRGASLSSEISRYGENGFRDSYSSIELPPYAALNAAAFKWRIEIAKKPG
ncbi:hypothetical protein EON80_02610 [bacterium]|nr:MAG: hypothetical protein EON80_02610 [bacterium]